MFVFAAALSIRVATLMHGGTAYSVRIDPRAAKPLQVWRRGHKLSEALFKAYHPWSLQLADVEGHGFDEIAVGLTKATKYLPFEHRTLFILRFDGEKIVRVWAGSSMGRPLVDFCFGPKVPGKGQTLITLERTLDGQVAISANEWMGFGFRKVGRQFKWRRADHLRHNGKKLILRADGRTVALSWKKLL